MIVKVRGPGKRIEDVTINLSMQVKELKEKVGNIFHVEPENQRLIHRGKQLEDEHKLWDYGVEIYDTVLLTVAQKVIQKEVVTENLKPFSLIKHLTCLPTLQNKSSCCDLQSKDWFEAACPPPTLPSNSLESEDISELKIEKKLKTLRQIPQSKYFKVGEYVDFLDTHFGAWFQGKIKIIYVEDPALLDAISEEVEPATQSNGNSKDDCAITVVTDGTKDTPAASTLQRDSPVVISDDESIDVVTVRSSSPESVIYIPPDDEPVIYIPPDEELEVYVPPPIYVEPYSDGARTVDTVDSTRESRVQEEITCVQSSQKTCAASDTNGVKTVSTARNARKSNESERGVHQEMACDRSSDEVNAASDTHGRKTVDTPDKKTGGTRGGKTGGARGGKTGSARGGKTVGAPGKKTVDTATLFIPRPNETKQEALQRALHEALQAMNWGEFSDKTNAVSDTDHSESGDSGHSSHMSLKNTSQSNRRPACEEAASQGVLPDDGCLYEIINLNNIDQIEMMCKLSQVRPMSRKRLDLAEIECGQTVLVNYSTEGSDKLGHWFDFKVSKVVNGSKKKWLEGDVKVLNWNPYLVTDVKITKVDMIWQIEKLTLLKQREEFCSAQNVQKRPVCPICDKCNDNLAAQCRACSCRVCGMKSDPSKQILCDECDSPFHVWCLNPPLAEVPDVDQWFCDNCNFTTSESVSKASEEKTKRKRGRPPKENIGSPEVWSESPKVKNTTAKEKNTTAKEKNTTPKQNNTTPKQNNTTPKQNNTTPKQNNTTPKQNNTTPKQKKSTLKEKKSTTKEKNSSPKERSSSPKEVTFSPKVMSVCTVRRNMANAPRTKMCTIVPPNHFGPIPGVEVGTTWRFRIQASEAGVHRPPVGGMHGREDVGAFSIVLSGGYEDDEDFGDYFWYTGAGGRDLSGNRRTTSRQSCDQLFTHTNKALAVNCDCPLSEEGGKAVDWRAGKPVRVLRSYKFRKRSQYAPEEGLRYDGIYKVVEYRPERGRSGYIVWRYLLRRDDPTPAPWTDEGKKFMETLGLEIEYPENYEPPEPKKKSEESSKKPVENHVVNESEENSLSYRIKLESCENDTSIVENHMMDENEEDSWSKRLKTEGYEIHPSIEQIIAKDEQNMRLWEYCSYYLRDGKKRYLEAVQESFTCLCCQELVYEPITTPCNHNVCMECLQRSFQAENYTCPTCSEALPERFPFVVNEHLSEALKAFFPGYGPQMWVSFEQGSMQS